MQWRKWNAKPSQKASLNSRYVVRKPLIKSDNQKGYKNYPFC